MMRRMIMAGLLCLAGAFFSGGAGAQDYALHDSYARPRDKILKGRPVELGLFPAKGEVWGLLMESGYDQGVVTLVALGDGTVSLYFSNGGGMTGFGEHDGPKRARRALLAEARKYLRHAQTVRRAPLPKRGHVRFHFLTADGIASAEADEEDLEGKKHALSALYFQAHNLISECRAIDERGRAKAP